MARDQRTQWGTSSRRRDRGCRDGHEDRHRRDGRQPEVGEDPERPRWREGEGSEDDTRGAQRYRTEGGVGALGLIAMRRAPPRLKPNEEKIQESILYLLNEHPDLTQYEIVKSLWFADELHLKRYGRPVTFDNYVAMERGPVPSRAYNVLKPNIIADRPWSYTGGHWVQSARMYTATRAADLDCLSETDVEVLAIGLKIVLETPDHELKKMLHEHPAYLEAWAKSHAGMRSVPMNLASIIGDDGEELAEDLAYVSVHA